MSSAMSSNHDTICMMDSKHRQGMVECATSAAQRSAVVTPKGAARGGRIGPPRPIKFQVCLSESERVQLSEQARAAGFETVSAFVRARALGHGPSAARGVVR